MANVDLTTLNAINRNLEKIFHDTIKLPTTFQKLATKFITPTTAFRLKWWYDPSNIEEYNIPSQPSKPFITTDGDYKNFSIRDWAKGFYIPKKDIEDDTLSQHVDILRGLANAAIRLPQELMEKALNDGEVTECMDGKFFFANDHNPGSGNAADNYSNLFAGSGTSLANLQTDLDTVRIAMYYFRAANGVPRGLTAKYAFIPKELEMNFKQMLNNKWNPAGNNSENPFEGILPMGTDSGTYLDDSNDWYLHAGNLPNEKPFIWAIKKGYESPKLQSKINPKDDNVFYQDRFDWLVETHANMIAGWPAYIAKIVNA